jgi:general secretion pathway protein F
MQFRVLAVRADGSTTPLVLDADSPASARRQLALDGLTALECAPAGTGRFGVRSAGGSYGAPRGFDVDLFCQELLALVTAGVSIGEALETLASRRSAGDAVLRGMLQALREGHALSAAMERYPQIFPVILRESLRAAERTSDYAPALERFVRYRRLSREIREKMVAAAIYPLLLLGVSTLVLLFLVGYVVPRFADVYADMGDRLPAASRLLLQLGSFLHANPWATVLGAIAVGGGVAMLVRDPRARASALGLVRRIPRLARVMEAADFSRLYRTLALLVHGGIPMVSSLEVARGMLPPTLARQLDACRVAISEGQSFSTAMAAHGLATPVADRLFRVGEGSGKLAEMIDRAADFHEEEVARGADLMGRVIGPFLMLIMGVVIGLVVVLMYMPIFSLAEAIQ